MSRIYGLAAALALLVPVIQARIDDRLGRYRAVEEVLYLGSGEEVRRLAPGLENLMADVYWLRTVQYYGGRILQNRRFELLEPLVLITVDDTYVTPGPIVVAASRACFSETGSKSCPPPSEAN